MRCATFVDYEQTAFAQSIQVGMQLVAKMAS